MRITVLAGGVGAARFLRGLKQAAPDAEITVIGNTGDDITLFGLRVCPDLDTVMYTLGGGIDEEQGWGRAGETFSVRDELAAYGASPDWFTLGDRDFATHIRRSQLLAAGQPLCLIGDSGTGKSHLLIGLGTAAAEQGYRVRYVTAAALVNELAEAADDRMLTRVIARYGRIDLLCLDELGYIELDRRGAELLFQVFTEREEKSSIAVASNAAFSEWAQAFTDPRLCAAIVDRLTYNAHIITTGTGSYRLRATTEALTGTMREVRPLTLPPERPGWVPRPGAPLWPVRACSTRTATASWSPAPCPTASPTIRPTRTSSP